MIYGCCLREIENEEFLHACFGIESPYYDFFYTTQANVKETLKKKFCEKRGMKKFTQEEFQAALEKIDGSKKNSDDTKYTFKYVSDAVDTIELKQIEEKEYNYGKGSEPTEWYCISYRS